MKISGSYASLLRGVSQQSPEVRLPGQHVEQVNLLSDPVQGLTRRRGSLYQALQTLPTPAANVEEVGAAAQGYRVHRHTTEGKDYVLLIRESLVSSTYATGSSSHSPSVICYNLTDSTFVPVASDAATVLADTSIGKTGISAVASVGRVLVMALKGIPVTVTNTERWNKPEYNRLVTWIRGGAYSRTYQLRFSTGGTASTTTPAPDATGAAVAISPQNIATAMTVTGATAPKTVVGSHIYFDIKSDASATDGGDGGLVRSVYNIIDDVAKLPILGYPNQIVKVETGPDTGFYVQAHTKTADPLSETRWVEAAGVEQASTVDNFYVAVIEDGTLRLAKRPADLVGTSIPQFQPSRAGDLKTNIAPTFLRGRPITYMGVFQDRLIVASGAAVAVSAAGDYFNFFRTTVATVPQNDAFEMIAQGGEDDTLRHGVTYSRNLVLFGDKRQYVISGNSALTPLSANMAVMTSYADAADVSPIAAGGQIYYARNREGNVSVYQIQPGAYVDSAESFPSSAQISTYIPADSNQLETVPGGPSQLLVRTRARPHEIFVFSYLDQPDGRKQDAWFRWEFDAGLGHLMGISNTPAGVLLFWLRHNAFLGRRDIVADLLPMSAYPGEYPYLDSMRPWADVAAGTQEVSASNPTWAVAFKRPSDRFLIGGDFEDAADLLAEYPTESSNLTAGMPFTSAVTLTNPFIKDGQGLSMLSGRTVITRLSLNLKESSGVQATVVAGGISTDYSFNARVLGNVLNQVGIIPVTGSIHTVSIGRESREYAITLTALKWYPLSIVGVEWTGQSFNRTPRA